MPQDSMRWKSRKVLGFINRVNSEQGGRHVGVGVWRASGLGPRRQLIFEVFFLLRHTFEVSWLVDQKKSRTSKLLPYVETEDGND